MNALSHSQLPSAKGLGRRLLIAISFLVVLARPACAVVDDYPKRPITIICPWAAGGGTDRVSRQLAMQLEQKLQVPVNVINATGGKGVTGHNRGLTARPDGYTLTMMTFELCTMHWMKLTDLTYEDCIPLLSLNEDYAALLVRKDAPWQSVLELENAILSGDTSLTASGTAAGGAWHLALAGWLDSAGLSASSVTWVSSAGAGPSLQQLISGGVDMVCCSLPEALSLLESGDVRALGVMSPQRAIGFDNVPTFPEQGRDWTLGGWRGLGVPLGTPEPIVERLRACLKEIVRQPAEVPGSFAAFMYQQRFDATSRHGEDFRTFMVQNDAKLGSLLQSEALKSVSEDRFDAMLYPKLILGMLVIALLGLVGRRAVSGQRAQVALTIDKAGSAIKDDRPIATTRIDWSGGFAISCVVGSIIGYILLAEWLGFIIVAFGLLLLLQIVLKQPLVRSMTVALVGSVGCYAVFAWFLRAALPAGLLG